MIEPPEPPETTALRLAALQGLGILDTPAEPEFDDVVLLATTLCNTPVALVSLVSNDRQWFKARIGFPACETSLDQSVCKFALVEPDLLVIPDLSRDPRTAGNTLVTDDPFIRFYAGAPFFDWTGVPIGSLCVIDTEPRPEGLSEPQRAGLKALARQVTALLEARRVLLLLGVQKDAALAVTSSALADERRVGGLRETFVAVLGHDLRNPLAALDAGIRIIERNPAGERAASVLPMMKVSVARMKELIETTLDFARARMGGGIGMASRVDNDLARVLQQVVEELSSIHPDAPIEVLIDLIQPVTCDRARIGQLLSNLLANALTHGDPSRPIRVEASTPEDRFVLSVANAGDAIPSHVLRHLFQPFVHAASPQAGQSLGLGLYIASEIARAHGGTLSATSTSEETRFLFQMPVMGT